MLYEGYIRFSWYCLKPTCLTAMGRRFDVCCSDLLMAICSGRIENEVMSGVDANDTQGDVMNLVFF